MLHNLKRSAWLIIWWVFYSPLCPNLRLNSYSKGFKMVKFSLCCRPVKWKSLIKTLNSRFFFNDLSSKHFYNQEKSLPNRVDEEYNSRSGVPTSIYNGKHIKYTCLENQRLLLSSLWCAVKRIMSHQLHATFRAKCHIWIISWEDDIFPVLESIKHILCIMWGYWNVHLHYLLCKW